MVIMNHQINEVKEYIMVRIEVTHSNFYDLYRENEFVRGLSFEAVDRLLDMHELAQEDSPKVTLDWTSLFMNSGEYNREAYISEFKEFCCTDEIDYINAEFKYYHGNSEVRDDQIIEVINHNKNAYILDSGNILLIN
jgi:hypothetical protein